ncbi:MAG: mechanosensitive ion channel [Prolixibacteraceae bacterium]|nr:mechanosensitive ion channel [Prolixibacteraceae bacterium]
MQIFKDFIYNWLFTFSGNEEYSGKLTVLIVGASIIVIALLSYLITKLILVSVIHHLAKKTSSVWDDIMVKNRLFQGASHLIPATVLYFFSGYANQYYPILQVYILKVSNLYFLFAIAFIIIAFLNSLNEIYEYNYSETREKSIKGAVQLLKILVYFISFLVFISIIFNKSLITLFTGLGAAAAVLMLVFKDTILGFVAGVQINMNNLVKIGDFIEMPSKNASGTVLEINLTSVKIQNSDKTIISIPTYSLVSESFVNWKGMNESGVRRIKRWINLDLTSIKFCDKESFSRIESSVIIRKMINISSLQEPGITNLTIFRKYLEEFLRTNPMIEKNDTLLVRHLQPTENGLPIEVNVYCKEQRWVEYENIQSDIFDHILAVIPEFELRVFQNPSGSDFYSIKK